MFSKITGKRSLAAVLALFFTLCFVLSGCGSSSSSVTELDSSNSDVETQAEEAETTDVTIEEQLLLEYEGITITATEYVEDDIWGDEINLLIENSGDTDIDSITITLQ